MQADPKAIPMLVEERDAAKVQARIRDKFGDEVGLVYCAALIAYTTEVAAQIRELEQRLAAMQPTLAVPAIGAGQEDREALFAHV